METANRIKQLEIEQNELRAAMAKSDDRQNHCGKTGKVFSEAYPEEYAEYAAAYEKYNANKVILNELREQERIEREAEEAEALRAQELEVEYQDSEYPEVEVGEVITTAEGEVLRCVEKDENGHPVFEYVSDEE